MSAVSEIITTLRAEGVLVNVTGSGQGTIVSLVGHPRALRLYAWAVTDNGEATGVERSETERRIQASRTKAIQVSSDPETVVLGWCNRFGPEPLLVAFNPHSVARRVNGKLARKIADGVRNARVSDSQQFQQSLLDEATTNGIALGKNQHGEYVVAMKPERIKDYLEGLKLTHHRVGDESTAIPAAARSMGELVAEAELTLGAPLEAGGEDALPAFDPALIEDGRERVAREIAVRRGQAAFRQQLLNVYGQCLMTGCSVEAALEAAHIVPYQGPGTNHLLNGLVLRADVHTLFDLGLLAVDPDTLTILVAQGLDGTEYETLRGQPLEVAIGGPSPSRVALRVHRALAGL